MNAGPSALAEVLVVGTDAFQQAKAALSHLPGQGGAPQVRRLCQTALRRVMCPVASKYTIAVAVISMLARGMLHGRG
jgi:hypothetical protein